MSFKLDEAREVLTQTPDVLRALLNGKSEIWLHSRKSPQSFSPIDVIGHLIHADRTDWIPRAQQILRGDGSKPFEPFDRFGFQPSLAGKTVETLLDEFAEARRQSLQTLDALGVEAQQLELQGTHPEFGAVTLGNLLATWVVHDLGHISQIVKIMSSVYREAVGPWHAYLSILNE
ncbi:MAG: DinB family protein [Terracidiphilus sp.]